jgi:hypothetical protein
VALNLAFLAPGEQGGLEVYARELARGLAARGDLELVLLGNRLLDEGWPDVQRVVMPVDPRRRSPRLTPLRTTASEQRMSFAMSA